MFHCHIADGNAEPVRIILDTDISSDVDDVGAVSLLHALAKKGEIKILAMMVSSRDPWSAPCLDALNTYFGQPDIPIGIVKGKSVVHRSKYTQTIADEFQHNLGISEVGYDAVSLYRKILTSSAGRSVVIVSIGYLTNLKNLLLSPSDKISSSDGRSLVKKKVKMLICMGGKYPSGREWNFYQDASAACFVSQIWPGPITFVGFETGVNVLTGSGLKETSMDNPVRRSYWLYNNLKDRSSWDQIAVLYAAKQGQDTYALFWERLAGENRIMADGSNKWMDKVGGLHYYLRLKKSPKTFAAIIEKLMVSSVFSCSD